MIRKKNGLEEYSDYKTLRKIQDKMMEILRNNNNNNNNTIEDSFYSLLILGAQKNSSIIFKTMEEKALNAYINQIPLNSKW